MDNITPEELAVAIFWQQCGLAPSPALLGMNLWKNRVEEARQILALVDQVKKITEQMEAP